MHFLIAEKQYQRFFPVKKQRFQEKEKMWLLDFSFKFIYIKFIKKNLTDFEIQQGFHFQFSTFNSQLKSRLEVFCSK